MAHDEKLESNRITQVLSVLGPLHAILKAISYYNIVLAAQTMICARSDAGPQGKRPCTWDCTKLNLDVVSVTLPHLEHS